MKSPVWSFLKAWFPEGCLLISSEVNTVHHMDSITTVLLGLRMRCVSGVSVFPLPAHPLDGQVNLIFIFYFIFSTVSDQNRSYIALCNFLHDSMWFLFYWNKTRQKLIRFSSMYSSNNCSVVILTTIVKIVLMSVCIIKFESCIRLSFRAMWQFKFHFTVPLLCVVLARGEVSWMSEQLLEDELHQRLPACLHYPQVPLHWQRKGSQLVI